MATATPRIGSAPVTATSVLQYAGDLLRHCPRWKIHPIYEIENAVHSCWCFQIDILSTMYAEHGPELDRIEVTAEDVLLSWDLPDQCQISPMAVLYRKNRCRYGPGRLLPARKGRKATTEYTFVWSPNHGAHSVLTGDIARGVLVQRIDSLDITYAQKTRTAPDAESRRLWRAIERWRAVYNELVPTEISLHPASALDYVRKLPEFTEALEALIAFESHVPSAVLDKDSGWTIKEETETDSSPRRIRPALSLVPGRPAPSRNTGDEPRTKVDDIWDPGGPQAPSTPVPTNTEPGLEESPDKPTSAEPSSRDEVPPVAVPDVKPPSKTPSQTAQSASAAADKS